MLSLLQSFQAHLDVCWQIQWHPKGLILASCSADQSIKLHIVDFSLNKVTLNGTLTEGHTRTIRSICFSPDGNTLIAGSFDSTASIWQFDSDEKEYQLAACLEGHENEIKAVSWSKIMPLVATCSRDKSIWIWEIDDENDFQCIAVLQEHSQDVKSVKWHPEKEILVSCSYDHTIKLWSEMDEDWYVQQTLDQHQGTVWQIDFNQTGHYMYSVSDDLSLKVWQWNDDVSRYQLIQSLDNLHQRPIYTVACSPLDGTVATAGGDSTITILKHQMTEEGKQLVIVDKLEKAHETEINHLVWHPTLPGKLASCSDDGMIKIWNFIQS